MSFNKSYYILTTLAVVFLFSFFALIVNAATGNLGGMHMPVNMAKGNAAGGATTTLDIFIRAGSPDKPMPPVGVAPTSTAYVWPQIFYKDTGDSVFTATSSCIFQGLGFYKCRVLVGPSDTTPRSFRYFIEIRDGDDLFTMPSPTTTPFTINIQNTNLGTASISGQAIFGMNMQPSVAVSATDTILLFSGPETYTNYDVGKIHVNDWVYIEDGSFATTTKVLATGTNFIQVQAPQTLTTNAFIYKKISNAMVFSEGTVFSALSSNNNNPTFGSFSLLNMATGTYNLISFKEGFCDNMMNGVFAPQLGNFKVMINAGCQMGGGNMGDKFGVMWTAPGDNMMGAPRDINLNAASIMVNLSQPATTTSLSLANTTTTAQSIFIKKIANGAIQDITASGGFQLGYQPPGGNVILLPSGQSTANNFGPDPKIIIYSTSSLEANTQYIIELTNSVFSDSGSALSGNRPEGGHSFMFTTSQDMSNMTGGQYGTGGQYMPPFVMGMMPQMGAFGVALNTNIILKFSDAMDPSSITYPAQNIRLCKITNPHTSSETKDCAITVQTNLDSATKKLAIVNPADLDVNSHYRVEVLGAIRSASGITISPPDQTSNVVFMGEFDTGANTDNVPPKIMGSNVANNSTGVGLTPLIEFGVNEGLDPTTVNSTNIKLKAGTSEISGTVEYDFGMNNIRFIPSSALMNSTAYTLTLMSTTSLTSGVKDLNGQALDGDGNGAGGDSYVLSFTTTANADSVAPRLTSAYADNFVLALNFNEPMRATAMTDTSKWSGSVLNLANYTIRYCSVGLSDCSTNGILVSTSSAQASYDAGMMTIKIENLQVSGAMPTPGGDYWVQADNIVDLSSNVIDATFKNSRTFIKNSQDTFGIVGPQSGGMMGPPSTAGGMMGPMIGMNDPGQMGMMPIGVHPMNAVAGRTTTYFVDLPTTVALTNGSAVVLTFPSGFDVTNAAPDAYSPANSDFNGPGSGIVTFDRTFDSDGVQVDAALRQIKIKLAVSGTTNAMEGYHFDLSGITNSNIPKDFGSPGYSVTLETRNGVANDAIILETKTSMPFFITEAGTKTLLAVVTGVASSTNANINMATSTLKVVLGSPMTGPMPTEITFYSNSRIATATFSGLSDGDYYLFTNPSNNLSVCANAGCTATATKEFSGIMIPEPIRISSATTTKSFSITRMDSGVGPINIVLNGTFKTGNRGDNVDIFAGGQKGSVVRTISTTSTNALSGCVNGVCTNATATLYLPLAGEYSVGIGVEAPKGMMYQGANMTMPDWMSPQSVMVMATGTAGSRACIENSDVANDCNILMTVRSASYEIRGVVKDSAGNGIPDAGIDAFVMSGFGMPAHTQTNSTGTFVLKVALSATSTNFGLNVFKPGLPPMQPKTITVYTNGNGPAGSITDGNTTADVYLDGGNPVTTANPLIIYIDKGGYTISGQVVDSADPATAKPVSNVPVWANNVSTGEFIPSGTDSSGNFILYVKAGTWKVGAHTMEFGDLPPTDVTISTQSVGSIILKPLLSKAQMAVVNGTVTIAGSVFANANIWIEGTDSNNRHYENGAMTDSSGVYSVKVPAGTFTIHCYAPEYGEIGKLSLTAAAGQTYNGKNFAIAAENIATLSFSFTNAPSGVQGFVDVFDPTNQKGQGRQIQNVASVAAQETMKVPAGTYYVRAHIPGFGEYLPTTPAPVSGQVTIAAGTSTVVFVLPTAENQVIISGTVTVSGSGSVSDAFVGIGNMTGFHYGVSTNASGAYSFKVPVGTYRMNVDKPGYSATVPADASFTTSTVVNFVLTQNSNYIIGQLTNSSGQVISNAWVWADKVNSATDWGMAGGWAGAQTDSQGNYKLSVGSGYWLVRANAEGYQEVRNTVAVAASSNPTVNLSLATISGFVAKETKSQPIIPAQGGILDDRINTGVKLVVPASALGSDTNNGKILVQEKTSLPKTDSKTPLKGKDINAYNSDNQKISNLSGTVDLEITYNESDIPTGFTESQLALAYWDETSGDYVTVPSVVDTANNTISAQVSHFSVYAPVLPTGTNPPSTPGMPSGSLSGTSISISWATSTDDVRVAGYEVYRNTAATGDFSNISGNSQAGGGFSESALVTSCVGGTCTYTDSTVAANTTYYYKIAAFDNDGNQSTASAVSAGIASFFSGGSAPLISSGGQAQQPTPTPTPTPTPSPTPTPGTTVEKPINQVPAPSALINQITKRLIRGMKDDQITSLQEFLAQYPEIYPEKLVTGYYGSLTEKAVQKFQKKYGIAKEGEAGFGTVGPKTMAKLNELTGTAKKTIQLPEQSAERASLIQTIKVQIQTLQEKLAQLMIQLVQKLQEEMKNKTQ